MLCEVNEPCAHTVVCENCGKIQLKRCPKCKTRIESKMRAETPELEKLLQVVAQLLGSKWQQVGRNLGIRNVQLEIIKLDNPLNTKEQSFQMLYKWYASCDQERRTLETLREALEAAECFEALQCLPSEER
ncbi:uncharacterized protein LOC106867311 [Octopus bimaculoides]|uniref:Death domain-containing protein n=1 Tax=Octopus bimaculoides TaxID=37653 RepID=A0A0L8I1L0_OCTBM|nr:uncharacterized protein LOC106867311 [Octopus bimaculoides]|eukprot:XP_014767636.1 PREDICTED: uncharacterized protein LOC106867311 [Octopus bimaculoides]